MAGSDFPVVRRGGNPHLYDQTIRARSVALVAHQNASRLEAQARQARAEATQLRTRYEAVLAEYEGQLTLFETR